jgi:prohibitin 2
LIFHECLQACVSSAGLEAQLYGRQGCLPLRGPCAHYNSRPVFQLSPARPGAILSTRWQSQFTKLDMSPRAVVRLVGVGIFIFVVVIMASSGTYVVQPGFRGVQVTMGKVSPAFKPEGFGLKAPFITTIHPVSIRQQTAEETAGCYSSDLQQVQVKVRILFKIPESSVVKLFQEYDGDPFDSLIVPRVNEAIKEVTALQSAEQIVKNREHIKTKSLDIARQKIGTILTIEDIVIENIALTKELEHAIEAKMVQEQDASKSKFLQQRAQIEADTAIIQAKGEAESIVIRGKALKDNPAFVDLKIVDKWDGITPLVIGPGENVIFNAPDLERIRNAAPHASPQSQPPARRNPVRQ